MNRRDGMMLPNILIAGRAGSGKDTVADYLVKEYGYKKIGFADYVYKIAEELFGMKGKNRKLLQDIAQSLRRIDSNVLVKHAFYKIDEIQNPVVIADCRQPNEYVTAVQNEFIPIRVVADEKVRLERLIMRDKQSQYKSLLEANIETGVDNYEFIEINNTKTKEELFKQVDLLLEQNKREKSGN